MNNVAMEGKKVGGIIKQLHSMLTNHPDRPKFMLNVFLTDKNGNVDGEDRFEIFANNPEDKVKEKVEKMRIKGGMPTLKISEFKKIADTEYTLILKI